MRANTKFINTVKQTLETMRPDERYSYVRGLLMVKGNTATSLELERILEKIKEERKGS